MEQQGWRMRSPPRVLYSFEMCFLLRPNPKGLSRPSPLKSPQKIDAKVWLVTSDVAVAPGGYLVSAAASVDDALDFMRLPLNVEWDVLCRHQGATVVWQRSNDDGEKGGEKKSGERTHGGTLERSS